MMPHGIEGKDRRIAELEGDLEGAKALIVKARVSETFEREFGQREWLQHQSERRMWRNVVLLMWAFSVGMAMWGMYLGA